MRRATTGTGWGGKSARGEAWLLWAVVAVSLWVAGGCGRDGDAEAGPEAGDSLAVRVAADSVAVDSAMAGGAQEEVGPGAGGGFGDEGNVLEADSLAQADSLEADGLMAEVDSLAEDSLAEDSLAADLLADDSLGSGLDSLAARETPAPPPTVLLASGTQVELVALEEISTDGYRTGDAVIAAAAQDVVHPDGTILVAAGTLFLGRITTSVGSGGIGEEPVLEMTFETISATDYERPVETLVIAATIVLDAEAERARARAGGRDRLVMVPGRIAAGSTIVVQIREPVRLPLPQPDSLLAGDSAAVADTISPAG